jgi:hypothetical protein
MISVSNLISVLDLEWGFVVVVVVVVVVETFFLSFL